LSKSILHI